MLWQIYQGFTIHATVIDISKQFLVVINSFSQLVDLLFLCDVTDTISRKY